jgi:hypothetical protein
MMVGKDVALDHDVPSQCIKL